MRVRCFCSAVHRWQPSCSLIPCTRQDGGLLWLPVACASDPRVPGLLHACGHEGAGVGLATGTGHVIAQSITGAPTSIDLAPFSPARFGVSHVG